MSFPDGEEMAASGGLRLKRLANAIPASYTVFKIGGTYYAETNIAGGTSYDDPDCTVAFQNALGALTTGGKIAFGLGDFYIDKITIPNNIVLQGSGWAYAGANSTRIRLNDGVNDNMFENDDQAGGNTNISFYNLNLYGNRANQTAGDIVNFVNADWVYFVDCYLSNAYSDCLYFGATCNVVYVDRCKLMTTSGGDCIHGLGLTDSWITRNDISSGASGRHGIYDGGGGNHILDNDVYMCKYHGIYMAGNYTFINRNRCNDNEQRGIEIDGSSYIDVSHNRCINNSNYGVGTYSGIDINNSSNCTIAHNQCFDTQGTKTQKYGVEERGTSDENMIQGNICRDNATAPYSVIGANSTYDARIISDAVQINGATTTGVLSFKEPAFLARAYLLYETAVTNDTNVEVGYGDVGGVNRDKYVASVTSGTGAIWETEALTLLAAKDIGVLDTVTLYQDGSGGAGEYIRLIIDVLYGA